MPRIRAVIFDCYRTLVDIRTDESKLEVFRYLSQYLQYYGADVNERSLKSALKHEKERYLRSSEERYPEVDLEVIFERILRRKRLASPFMVESCCKLFRLLSRERFQLFPDSLPVLKEIRRHRYPMAVVSDAQKVFCLEEGEMLGIDEYFDHIVLSTQYGFTKPDRRLFDIACSLLGLPPEQVVYIGDHPEKDVHGAKQTGMSVVLLDRDSRVSSQSSEMQPDFHARDLWEAWHWIRSGA